MNNFIYNNKDMHSVLSRNTEKLTNVYSSLEKKENIDFIITYVGKKKYKLMFLSSVFSSVDNKTEVHLRKNEDINIVNIGLLDEFPALCALHLKFNGIYKFVVNLSINYVIDYLVLCDVFHFYSGQSLEEVMMSGNNYITKNMSLYIKGVLPLPKISSLIIQLEKLKIKSKGEYICDISESNFYHICSAWIKEWSAIFKFCTFCKENYEKISFKKPLEIIEENIDSVPLVMA